MNIRNDSLLNKNLPLLSVFFVLQILLVYSPINYFSKGIVKYILAGCICITGSLIVSVLISLNKRDVLRFLCITLLLMCSRYLLIKYASGIFDSDDAVAGLMARDFCDDKGLPVFFYGQFYLGSFPAIVYSLFFKIFGAGLYTLSICSILIFSVAVQIQLKTIEIISEKSGKIRLVLFYVFCGGILLRNIFMAGGNFAFVYLFLSLIVWLSLKNFKGDKTSMPIYVAGLICGLAYWTHQITLIFTIVLFLIMIIKRVRARDYILFSICFAGGAAPLVLFEVTHSFQNLKFILFSGSGAGSTLNTKFSVMNKGLQNLFAAEGSILFFIISAIIVFVIVKNLLYAYRERCLTLHLIVYLFFASYIFFFLLSGFSGHYVERYFMPLYILIPLIVFAGSERREVLLSLLQWVLLAVISFTGVLNYLEVAERSAEIAGFRELSVRKIGEVQKPLWYSSFYMNSYIYNFMSSGVVRVVNYQKMRYLPDLLDLYRDKSKNIIPLRRSYFRLKLDKMGINYDMRNIGHQSLFYNIKSKINLSDTEKNLPLIFPEIKGAELRSRELIFRLAEHDRRRCKELRLNVVIKTESDVLVRKTLLNSDEIFCKVPDFIDGAFSVTAFYDLRGTEVPLSLYRKDFTAEREIRKRKDPVIMYGSFCSGNSAEYFNLWEKKAHSETAAPHCTDIYFIEKKSEFRIKKQGEIEVWLKSLVNSSDFRFHRDIRQIAVIKRDGAVYEFEFSSKKSRFKIPAAEQCGEYEKISVELKYVLPVYIKEYGYSEAGALLYLKTER